MNYAVEMGSGAMIYIPSFIKDWFRHSQVNKPTLVFFFQNKKSRLKAD
jgi:hypothetical protein